MKLIQRVNMRASVVILLLVAFWSIAIPTGSGVASSPKTLIFDEAGLLTQAEMEELEAMAYEYGSQRETDFIIVTSSNPEGDDVMRMTQNFYDEYGPGYDKPYGNAVILMLDMYHREIYLAGFYKAKEYLDDDRLDLIREKITPYLSDGEYARAFEIYVKTAYDYMGYEPGVNPESILFKLWFQITVSLIVAGIVVGIMAYHSGGRVTVNRRTYEDTSVSGVTSRRDQYIRTTVTRRRMPRNDSRGGGGGGVTGGGHSHSGSRGSF